jgi:hypothetical protein
LWVDRWQNDGELSTGSAKPRPDENESPSAT